MYPLLSTLQMEYTLWGNYYAHSWSHYPCMNGTTQGKAVCDNS